MFALRHWPSQQDHRRTWVEGHGSSVYTVFFIALGEICVQKLVYMFSYVLLCMRSDTYI